MLTKKVAILATMPKNGYSGGRYHALIMALAFAVGGHKVHFFTNNVPEMWSQVVGHNYSKATNVTFELFSEVAQKDLVTRAFDLVVCVPGSSYSEVYRLAIKLAKSNEARLSIINFESGNWFNSLSPVKRSNLRWLPWKLTATLSDSVVSSSITSNRFAETFYKTGKRTNFVAIPPAVNDHVKRITQLEPSEEFRIFIPTRIRGGYHKGIGDFYLILSKLKKPSTVVLNVDKPNDIKIIDLKDDLERRGIEVVVTTTISEDEKFREYAKASVTVFPSYFEGFGYPPLESILSGTPCIAYELPVIGEVTRNRVRFTKRGDPLEMAKLLASMQKERPARISAQVINELLDYYSLDAYSERLEHLFGANRQKRSLIYLLISSAVLLSLKSFGLTEIMIQHLSSRLEEMSIRRSSQVGR